MTGIARTAAFSVVTGVLVAIILEVLLAVVTAASPKAAQILAPPTSQESPAIDDPRLGHRPNPDYPDHDARGFRNPSVLDTADIVALGDSQTYGAGVPAEETWTRQLELLAKQSVYNMAFGGWGPTHSLVLLPEAMEMQPKLIIEAFYTGNDLYDSFNMVYNEKQLSEFLATSPDIQAAVETVESSQPLAARVARLYQAGTLYPQASGLRHFLAVHSRIYGLLRAVWYEARTYLASASTDAAWQDAKSRAALAPDIFEVFEDGNRRTIFNSAYRLSGMDLQDVRIAEGLRISLAAIVKMQRECEQRGIRFMVIGLPTKQQVFRPLVAKPSKAYQLLVENEDKIRDEMRSVFATENIEYVDMLPPLREELIAGRQPYQQSHDGHPNGIGHLAIARSVAAQLGRDAGQAR